MRHLERLRIIRQVRTLMMQYVGQSEAELYLWIQFEEGEIEIGSQSDA